MNIWYCCVSFTFHFFNIKVSFPVIIFRSVDFGWIVIVVLTDNWEFCLLFMMSHMCLGNYHCTRKSCISS